MTQLREQGIKDLADVERACMEGDGRISIVTTSPHGPHQQRPALR